tara:strand:+ start:127 stop:504 length:378 start_codon:yes stop_codon:yes gene_type:complete
MAKKKKWKKRLGKALAVGAALAGGLALAKRRNRAASMADVEGAEAGFGDMRLKNYGPHKIGGYHTPRIKRPRWEGATNLSGDIFGMDATGDIQYAMPAKGGRIVKTKKGGVARRGLGRAFLKGRK